MTRSLCVVARFGFIVPLIALAHCASRDSDGASSAGPAALAAPDSADAGDGGTCTLQAHDGIVLPNGTLAPRPSGWALRLGLAYQGSRLAIVAAAGVDMTLPPSVGPFTAGLNSGYWSELVDAKGQTLDTRIIQDPTIFEIPPPPPHAGAGSGFGGFSAGVRPFCSEKLFGLDVPNDPTATALIIFGSPYGTQGAATEIARFELGRSNDQ